MRTPILILRYTLRNILRDPADGLFHVPSPSFSRSISHSGISSRRSKTLTSGRYFLINASSSPSSSSCAQNLTQTRSKWITRSQSGRLCPSFPLRYRKSRFLCEQIRAKTFVLCPTYTILSPHTSTYTAAVPSPGTPTRPSCASISQAEYFIITRDYDPLSRECQPKTLPQKHASSTTPLPSEGYGPIDFSQNLRNTIGRDRPGNFGGGGGPTLPKCNSVAQKPRLRLVHGAALSTAHSAYLVGTALAPKQAACHGRSRSCDLLSNCCERNDTIVTHSERHNRASRWCGSGYGRRIGSVGYG